MKYTKTTNMMMTILGVVKEIDATNKSMIVAVRNGIYDKMNDNDMRLIKVINVEKFRWTIHNDYPDLWEGRSEISYVIEKDTIVQVNGPCFYDKNDIVISANKVEIQPLLFDWL